MSNNRPQYFGRTDESQFSRVFFQKKDNVLTGLTIVDEEVIIVKKELVLDEDGTTYHIEDMTYVLDRESNVKLYKNISPSFRLLWKVEESDFKTVAFEILNTENVVTQIDKVLNTFLENREILEGEKIPTNRMLYSNIIEANENISKGCKYEGSPNNEIIPKVIREAMDLKFHEVSVYDLY